MQALRKIYPAERFELFKTIRFQFDESSEEPSLEINVILEDDLAVDFEYGKQASFMANYLSSSNLLLFCAAMQILCSEIDFWAGRNCTLMKDTKLMHEVKVYPPKVTLMVHNKNTESRTAAVTMEILGVKKKASFVIIAKSFGAGTMYMQAA